MKKRLIFFPSDPIIAYIQKGKSYKQLEEYYNPGNMFDEVYCLSPWGEKSEEKIGNITYIRADILDFKKIIKKIHPTVVRGYGGYCCADWVSISKVKGIPYIVSVHDPNPKMIHESLKYADAIICMSDIVKTAVTQLVDVSNTKIYTMGNRIDTNLFCPKKDDCFFEKLNQRYGYGKHILHVGRKSEEKNIETVIKALSYLPKDYSCVFVGRGNCEEYIELAKHNNCLERCFFEQSVANSELPYWYSWCDYFVVPSKWEGFGVVFIEAASCGALIITSDIAPMNTYLNNGENAVLVSDYNNPKSIAEAILHSDEKSSTLRKNARKVGLSFKKEVIDEQEKNIYTQVMSQKPNELVNRDLREYYSYNHCSKFKKIAIKINSKIYQMIYKR